MMKMMKSEKRLCVCCMEEHEVKTVLVQEHASFKNEQISYEAMYEKLKQESIFLNAKDLLA